MSETLSPLFCDRCAQGGVEALADFVYQPKEASLAGPLMGDPDCWPEDTSGRKHLCEEHYATLSADKQMDYIPVLFRAGAGEWSEG